MFQQLDTPTRQMLNGNLMLVACCVFYLAWWVIAFRPEGAVKGIKSGWLLQSGISVGKGSRGKKDKQTALTHCISII